MLKKVGAVMGAAAGLMMFAGTAFAADGDLVHALNGNNVNGTVGACGNDISVLGVNLNPTADPVENCAAGGILDENGEG
ncbi:hypothetical protein [Actinosynnema sp. NPDC020468]|uniref:hypothetical protein n=1 Tax=Actinosynnema sp. NPDC020468 TaxID=3154488 RepID=UPI00340F0D01